MSTYRMIALDLDGTLLNEERHISVANRQAIAQALASGFVVCISTGRGMKSALEHVAPLALQGPFVTANGSEVWLTPDRLLSRSVLSAERVARLLEVATRHDAWFWSYTTDGLLIKEDFDGEIERTHWLKFGFYDEDLAKLQLVWTEIKDWSGLEISNSHPKNIEVNPEGVTKASGLQMICDQLGFTMAQVIACGDSLNDLQMIKEAGLGVAMGNAQQAVKEIADHITLSNEEDGVAAVIHRFLLGDG